MRLSLLALVLVTLVPGFRASDQAPQPAAGATVADVHETLAAARKAIDAFRAGGGKPGAADHPALTWHETLWAYRERHPDSDAAAVATAEAIQLLIRAELGEKARARVDSLSVDDRAWEHLSAYLYYDASARKDFGRAAGMFSKVANATRLPSIKAAALLSLGRVQRRQGDMAAAVKSLEAARDAAPGTDSASESEKLLYDIANLSIGLQAPVFSAAGIDGRTISLDGLRGRAVAMVFWGST
jgi:hypothetical protein